MSGLEIKKTDKLLTQNSTQATLTNKSDSSDIQISFKYNDIEKPDKETENKIKAMVMLLEPTVDWDSLTETEKALYYNQYKDGTLLKRFKEFEPQINEFRESLKQMTPEEATKKLIYTAMERKDPTFKDLSESEQRKKIEEEGLRILKEYKPELDIDNMSEKEKVAQLKQYEFKIQAACYAFQSGKINKLEEFRKFSPTEVKEIEYEFAKNAIKKEPKLKQENFTMKKVIAQGNLEHAIAEANNLDIEEYRTSGNRYAMMYEYLKNKPEEELNGYEKKQLETLNRLAFIYDEDLKGMKLNEDGSVTDSYLHKLANGKAVNWDELSQRKILIQKLKSDLEACESPEAKQACLALILTSVNDIEEAMIIADAFATVEKQGIVSGEDLFIAAEQAKLTSHALVACSHNMSEEGQVCTAKHVANNCKDEHAEFSAKQAASFTKNVIPKYAEKVQAETTNTMTDTGLQEIYDVLPETYSKLEENAAKEAYQHAMNSENISAEQKAIIARDTIDIVGDNKGLKEFFEKIATENKIDYESVPPKSQRATTTEQANAQEEKVANTNYAPQEVTAIINKSVEPQSFVTTVINSATQALEIILGKTPETEAKTQVQKYDSLNQAISELKAGTKLTDVFKNSTLSVKQDLVVVICTYGKNAIGQLIDSFGGETIYNLAKTKNQKDLIKKEIERIALSDSTQRTALADIKKQESKQGLGTLKA